MRSESDVTPIYKADPNPNPLTYIAALEEASDRPAYAKILVDSETTDGEVSCVVHGRISDGISTDGLYICASLIENDIPAEAPYIQSGIYDAPDDATEDLVERFRHNGIVRIEFNKEALGDPLEIDPVTREFSVDFGRVPFNSAWKAENCEVIAFICRVNKDDLHDNYVLNAGGTRWNKIVDSDSGIDYAKSTPKTVNIYVGSNHRIIVDGDYTSIELYSLDGCRISSDSVLASGIYVVNVILPDGNCTVSKIAVK